MKRTSEEYSCPSAQPDSRDARVFGIVGGSVGEPRVSYLEKGVDVLPDVLETIDVSPTRVFRFSAKCENAMCGQFRDGGCRLGKDIVRGVEPVAEQLPACTIRGTCRWFAENGREVCLRCARVVTTVFRADTTLGPILNAEPANHGPA